MTASSHPFRPRWRTLSLLAGAWLCAWLPAAAQEEAEEPFVELPASAPAAGPTTPTEPTAAGAADAPGQEGEPAEPPPLDLPDVVREWRSRDGGSLDGRLVSLDASQAIVQRVDGRHFAIALERLSSADLRWLAEQQAAADARGESLVHPFDLSFRVLCRLESAGRLIDTGEVTPMGARVQRREPPTYAVLLKGTTTGEVFAVPVVAAVYESWREGFQVPRRSLALMLHTTEAELAGLYPYPFPQAVVIRALYGANGGYRDVTFDVVAQIVSGGQGVNLASLAGDSGGTPQELLLTILTPHGPTVRAVRDGASLAQVVQ